MTSTSAANEVDLRTLISSLTIPQIETQLKQRLTIPKAERRPKERFLTFVLAHAPADALERLKQIALGKQTRKDEHAIAAKRKNTEQQRVIRKKAQADELNAATVEWDPAKYMELPTEEQVNSCYRRFHAATSNAGLKNFICGVCARDRDHLDNQSTVSRTIPLSSLPNSHRLVPKFKHPAHFTINDRLFERKGLTDAGGSWLVTVCDECWTDLSRSSALPPRYSLANNLWIGDIPWELQCLTFPEQLLIALLYPRVFVFKLFPKKRGGERKTEGLQNAMRGNVCTYELDNEGVAEMVKGNMMPRPPDVLASVISVTFIGLGDLPKNWIYSTFRVRRPVVARALQRLRVDNPKYFGGIEISAERLALLPEDGVPREIEACIRQSEDIGVVDEESAGYVPDDEGDNEAGARESSSSKPADSAEGGTASQEDPDVIPFQLSGAFDTDLAKLTTSELMAWGLANLWQQGDEGGYQIRHGARPVNDFGRPLGERRRRNAEGTLGDSACMTDPNAQENYFEKAFPVLFPYGCGGIEADRPVPLDFPEHIRWCLRHHSRRFRTHETFPFVVFGIQQKRQALGSARAQMKRKTFDADARVLSTITEDMLAEAVRQEERGERITNPAITLLRSHMQSTAGRVNGTDAARYRWRSKMWSTTIYLNPASLWLTINPCDLHDPVAQIFAGEEIDMDRFVASTGPDKEARARNIASDPYAAAKFFHFTIRLVIETLFGVKSTKFKTTSTPGIFGHASAYFGAVEAQGRGSLHLHLLLWLAHAPSSDEIHRMLKTEEFRQRMIAFVRANLRAYLPGLESADSVKAIPMDKEVAWSRPLNPDDPAFADQLPVQELAVVRSQQVHFCEPRRCLVIRKDGRIECKRKAPWDVNPEDFVLDTGEWGPKRLYGFINGWVPGISRTVRCNNDGKLLTNGKDTKNVSFYVTGYAAKKQNKHHNTSAIMAKGYAYHVQREAHLDSIRDQQRMLLFRLVNTVNREQEISAPMVMSYLMGWGDCYESHHYTPIYWSSFVGRLFHAFPGLRSAHGRPESPPATQEPQDTTNAPEYVADEASESDDESDEEEERLKEPYDDAENEDEIVDLQVDASGNLYPRSQVTDYMLRGEGLSEFSALSFFVDTWEADWSPKHEKAPAATGSEEHEGGEKQRRGRKAQERIQYLSQHPSYGKKVRVVRTEGHNNLPNFIGRYFPRRDDPDVYPFYCASMLMLLKPWRDPLVDLKDHDESWETAFSRFLATATEKERRVLSGIQYFHECQLAAEERRQADVNQEVSRVHESAGIPRGDAEVDELGEDALLGQWDDAYSEEGLRALEASSVSLGEENHGRMAVEIAKHYRLFDNDISGWRLRNPAASNANPIVANATGGDLRNLIQWRAQMSEDVRASQNVPTPAGSSPSGAGAPSVDQLRYPQAPVEVAPSVAPTSTKDIEEVMEALHLEELKVDQLRAYEIIMWHLEQRNAGRAPPPLRMILYGEGGTGKSRVIQTVTDAFAHKGCKGLLVKAAYTGVAASLIDGKTLHVIGHISVNGRGGLEMSSSTKKNLQEFWGVLVYLIIDEYSMLAKSFLAKLSRHISVGKQQAGETNSDSFGGISVILCGDQHQFPPVASARGEALYHPTRNSDTPDMKIGREIYEEFTTVVILREQMRVTDHVWRDFLGRLRNGQVERRDLDMLRTLVVGHPSCMPTDWSDRTWTDAALVTPRHGVRRQWNDVAIRQHCSRSGQRVFICPAEDTINRQPLTLAERYGLATRAVSQRKGRSRQKDLPNVVEIAIGAKVLVTQNLETDLDVTNGARGEVVGIVLEPNEPPYGDAPEVRLTRPPLYVLVKFQRTRAQQLDGLEEKVLPIEPVMSSMRIQVRRGGTMVTRTVKRRQLPMTAAYAFTDYRSQGQTIPAVIADVAKPPSGKLDLFNVYVALSRSSGRGTIRLLRDFDDDLFLTAHEPELLMEDDRLEKFDRMTKDAWAKMKEGRIQTV